MTALKKTVRTRRGVEPAGRPARREVERGRRARTNSSRTFAQRAGRPRSRAARPGGATVVAPAEVAIKSDGRIVGRRRRAVVVVNQSSFEIRHISNISGGREKGEGKRRRTAAPSARRHVPPGVLVVLERLLRPVIDTVNSRDASTLRRSRRRRHGGVVIRTTPSSKS